MAQRPASEANKVRLRAIEGSARAPAPLPAAVVDNVLALAEILAVMAAAAHHAANLPQPAEPAE